MQLKGHMVVELTDINTNEKEVIVEDNMVTNAVNDILGTNPMGVFYTEQQYSNGLVWTDNLLPICPNMIGGIILFQTRLEENVDNIYPDIDWAPVGYASNDVNNTANTKRGSLNLNESEKLPDGYKFVWEFGPSQVNGGISCIALTSALGGKNAFGSEFGSATTFLKLKSVELPMQMDKTDRKRVLNIVDVDFENSVAYSIRIEDGSVVVDKLRMPIFDIGLNEKIDGENFQVVETSLINEPQFVAAVQKNKNVAFLDGGKDYWLGVTNEMVSGKNDVMTYLEIQKSSKQSVVWTVEYAGGNISEPGKRDDSSGVDLNTLNCCLVDRELYILNKNRTGFEKISIDRGPRVDLLATTGRAQPLGTPGPSEVYITKINELVYIFDRVIFPNIYGEGPRTNSDERFCPMSTPLFRYKEFLVCWGADYSKTYRTMFLYTPYLATINNLSSSINKTPDTTMKITYTLREVTDNV